MENFIGFIRNVVKTAGKYNGLLLLAFAIVATMSPGVTNAQGLNLVLNGKSFHLDEPAGVNYNETNTGGGLQYDFGPNRDNAYPYINFGGLKDSFENNSYYAGGGIAKRFRAKKTIHVDFGITAFLMTREDRNDNKPFPGLLPMMTIGTDRVGINITYVPKVEPKSVPLFFLQLKLALGSK